MRPRVLAIQKFSDVHAHEARSTREASSYGNLDAAPMQINLAGLDADPMPLGLPGEALDEIVHWAKMYEVQY